ncbi:protein arginine N-methyltransferase 7-like [Saccostrea cucullata]|uniref:protein arginine N-methyltransferase 7-like n=1 Tax=Saccostrea cuccullata TaxID=36930 RepID=UPI002ED240A9
MFFCHRLKLLFTPGSNIKRKMSTLVSIVNPCTGKLDWKLQDDSYDYHQEIARSGYADMLHDTERNKKYYAALEEAIQIKRHLGEPVHVLDIGTGTGLLSMMAAKLGADSVTACEAFEPMAKCAKKIIQQNGFENKIRLIPKRSTDVTVGADGDMLERANILVTEVFDTELIGEGAINTFTHAHKELLKKNCIVVPTDANMYVQVVSSDFIRRWRDIRPVKIPGCEDIVPPPEMTSCGGAPALHDLQLHELPQSLFQVLSSPMKVFRFDFSGNSPLKFENQSEKTFEALCDGQTDGVLMWWDLEMDTKNKINLSCAPGWAHPRPEELQWRDHWMQAIFYPNQPLSVQKGENVKVISNHDEYSLWFNVQSKNRNSNLNMGPACTCGMHVTYSRSQIGMLNDPHRKDIYYNLLKQNVTTDSVIMTISDGSLLPLIAARLGAKKVFALETNSLTRRILQQFIKHNGLEDRVTVLSKEPEEITEEDLENCKIDLVVGDPYFQSAVLPWHHVHFWYAAKQLSKFHSVKALELPRQLTIKAMAVCFQDLWKIRSPVGLCEGFNIQLFDEMVEASAEVSDSEIEPQPLWEYPCTACSDPVTVQSFRFSEVSTMTYESQYSDISIRLDTSRRGKCNGIVLWAEYQFTDELTISLGPREKVIVGEKVEWDFYSKQGVHLLMNKGKSLIENIETINVSLTFVPINADFDFTFKTVKS